MQQHATSPAFSPALGREIKGKAIGVCWDHGNFEKPSTLCVDGLANQGGGQESFGRVFSTASAHSALGRNSHLPQKLPFAGRCRLLGVIVGRLATFLAHF
jgi:hypothetical protein